MIVALDVESADEARRIVSGLGSHASFYKIGLQVLTADGPALARGLVAAVRSVIRAAGPRAAPDAICQDAASALPSR